jgi:hypothetical protein
MRRRFTVGLLALAALVFIAAAKWPAHAQPSAPAQTPAPRTPVLVELFTSEGCSDCPPADALLTRLVKTQPVSGAQVIALEHHVDYWDQQGWRDPYSSPDATARQTAYSASLPNNGPYTPQMVVDGTAELIGNNSSAALRAIDRAVKSTKSYLDIHWPADMAHFGDPRPVLEVSLGKLGEIPRGDSAEVFLAITEDNLHSDVARGENKGRALDHTNVVRRLDHLGKADPSKDVSFTARPTLNLGKNWNRANLHAVVFVQENKSRHVLAVASLAFPAP